MGGKTEGRNGAVNVSAAGETTSREKAFLKTRGIILGEDIGVKARGGRGGRNCVKGGEEGSVERCK